jgi:cytochrome c peroxidase
MKPLARALCALALLLAASRFVTGGEFALLEPDKWSGAELAVLKTLHIDAYAEPPPDPSNAYERSPAAAALGKKIFFDPRFSGNQQVSCASCHDPGRQFQDGRPLGVGIATGLRRTMPIAAGSASPWQFWDGRKDSVWAQALGPLEDPKEHGGNRAAYARLLSRHYRREYEAVFQALPEMASLPADASPLGTPAEKAAWAAMSVEQRREVSRVFANMGKAIAAYERTLQHGPSRLDGYIAATVRHAPEAPGLLAPEEKRGLRLFIGKGQCITCHAGPLLTDQHFHNTGVPPRDRANPDRGRAGAIEAVMKDEFNCLGPFSDARRADCAELEFIAADDPHMLGAFKTPSLRNAALRPPYMHAGQIATLAGVIRHYATAPAAAVGRNERKPMPLSEQESADLAAFLGTLSGGIREDGRPLK